MPAATPSIIHYAVLEDLKNIKLTTRDIARRNGVSAPTLYKIARLGNFDMVARDKARIAIGLRGFGIPPVNENREAILVQLRESELSATAIAKAFGVDFGVVSKIAKDCDIQIDQRRTLIRQLEALKRKKNQLEGRLARVTSELEVTQGLFFGKDVS